MAEKFYRHSLAMNAGPRRNLITAVEDLRQSAGSPSLNTIALWVKQASPGRGPSRPTISDAFKGSAAGGGAGTSPPTWSTVERLATTLIDHAGADNRLDLERIRELWRSCRDDAAEIGSGSERRLREITAPKSNTAEAFARSTFEWSQDLYRSEMPSGIQGCVAVSVHGLSLEASRRAFDVHMHYALDRCCDCSPLRSGRGGVKAHYRFGSASVGFHGVTDSRLVALAFEIHAFGAVAVYYRVDFPPDDWRTESGNSSGTALRSTHEALFTAYMILNVLGWSGSTSAATLLDFDSADWSVAEREHSTDSKSQPRRFGIGRTPGSPVLPSALHELGHSRLPWRTNVYATHHGALIHEATPGSEVDLWPSDRGLELTHQIRTEALKRWLAAGLPPPQLREEA